MKKKSTSSSFCHQRIAFASLNVRNARGRTVEVCRLENRRRWCPREDGVCAADTTVNPTSSESPRRSTLESSRTCPWRRPPPTTSRQPPCSLSSATTATRECARWWQCDGAWCHTSPSRLPTSRAFPLSTQRPRPCFQNPYGEFRFIAGAASFPLMVL